MSTITLTQNYRCSPAVFLRPYGDTYLGEVLTKIDDVLIADDDLALVPLDTCIKGPLYTVATAETISMTTRPLGAKLEIGYSEKDTPSHTSLIAYFDFVKNPLSRFLVSPYIYTLHRMNDYNCNTRFAEREISILDFAVRREGWGNYHEEVHHNTKGALTKFLKQNSLNTVTGKFFRLYDADVLDTARFVSTDKRLRRILVHIPDTEVCFALPTQEFKRLSSFERVEFDIFRTYEDTGEEELLYQYAAVNIWEILRACLYLPDLFYFDTSFYQETLSYRINVYQTAHDDPLTIDVAYFTRFGQRKSIYYSLVNMPK